MNNSFDNFLDSAGKALEVAPKLYDDAISPTAKELGKTIALVPQAINASLSSVRQWIAHKEYNVSQTEILLAEKLKNVDPNKIVSPEPYVAVPALQAISYSMDNYQLRNLYANLLANSMNSDTKNNVLPCFVEIIKQLSPLDAQVFQYIYSHEINPLIHLKQSFTKDKGFNILVRNVTLINLAPVSQIAICIDNLTRLNLIEVPADGSYTQKSHYDSFRTLDIYKHYLAMFSNTSSSELKIDEKVILKTEIGKLFYDICVKEG